MAHYTILLTAIAVLGIILTMKSRIHIEKRRLTGFCRKNGIRRLSLFGSVLRSDFASDSDVDVLVEFKPGHVPGFFQIYRMEQDLSRFFGNRKVDLRTPQDLSRYFRDDVLALAEEQYAER